MAPDPKLTAKVMTLRWKKGITLSEAWAKVKKDNKKTDKPKKKKTDKPKEKRKLINLRKEKPINLRKKG